MMIKAGYSDRKRVVDILSAAFDKNKSVNYIIPQDRKRKERIRKLMEYSFDICLSFGEVFLSADKTAAALLLYPEKKKTTMSTTLLDIKLILFSIGIRRIGKAMNREQKIKKLQDPDAKAYLWFIGVDPDKQHRGTGTSLLGNIIEYTDRQQRPLYLETSTVTNIPWYTKAGFSIYNELDLGYRLYFLNRILH